MPLPSAGPGPRSASHPHASVIVGVPSAGATPSAGPGASPAPEKPDLPKFVDLEAVANPGGARERDLIGKVVGLRLSTEAAQHACEVTSKEVAEVKVLGIQKMHGASFMQVELLKRVPESPDIVIPGGEKTIAMSGIAALEPIKKRCAFVEADAYQKFKEKQAVFDAHQQQLTREQAQRKREEQARATEQSQIRQRQIEDRNILHKGWDWALAHPKLSIGLTVAGAAAVVFMALKAPSKSSLEKSEPPPPPAQAERVRPTNYDEIVRGTTTTSKAESPEQVKAKRLQTGEQIAASLTTTEISKSTTEISKTVTIPAGVSDQEAMLSLNTLFSSKYPGLNTGLPNSRTGAINEKFLGYFLDAAGKSAASADTSKPRTYTIAFYNDENYVDQYRSAGTHIRFSGDLSRADQEKQLGTIGLKMAPVEQAAIVFAAEACKDPAKNDFGLRGRVDGLRVAGVSLVDQGKGLEVVKGDDRGDSGNPSNILVTKP